VTERETVPGIISVLRRTSRAMVAELVQCLTEAGYPDVQPAFHPVFENIDDAGSRLTDLAKAADMTHQSMSELVGILERRGYVERRPDPSDARARLVCLTESGRTLRTLGSAYIREIESEWQQRWRRAGIRTDVRAALAHALNETQSPDDVASPKVKRHPRT